MLLMIHFFGSLLVSLCISPIIRATPINKAPEEPGGSSKQQMRDAIGSSEFVEVRRLLDEIKVASLKKHGLFSDQDPTRERARQRVRDRVTFDDGTEASINRAVAEDLFENDILLTLPQAKQILAEINVQGALNGQKRRGRRQANPTPSSIWGSVYIPYVFQVSQTDANWQTNIRNGHRHIESLTCIRFMYHTSDYRLKGKDYLQYFRGTGCWSQVGKTGGRQPVSIGYGCEALGIVAHETLHALGLWHEQSRLDRDNFIRINLDAILPGTESNFEKRTPGTSDNMGQPYDLGSAMHYGNKAFSSDSRSYTILTMDQTYQQTIGQRGGLSFKDAKMINMRYCSEICRTKLDCENGGYTDPLNCNECRCPDGYAGDYCQRIPKSNAPSCISPGEYAAGQWPGTVKTLSLVGRSECYWRIHPLHPSDRVVINVKKLEFPCKDACTSYLEIKFKKDKIATGARLCCGAPATIYADVGTDVLLILKTDYQLTPGYLGFELSFKSIGNSPTVRPSITVRTTTKPEETTTTTTTETTTTTPEQTTTTTTEVTTEETTTTTTTEAPTTTTTEEEEEGKWSEWGPWSGCSATCGACGQRRRVRICQRGKCKGDSQEMERCGHVKCPTTNTTKPRPNRCQGRLVMPCNLMQNLDFGTVINYDGIRRQQNDTQNAPMLDSNIVLDEKAPSSAPSESNDFPALLLTENNAEILRRNRRNSRSSSSVSSSDLLEIVQSPRVFCEKRFTYNCPTALLTISMDWHVIREDDQTAPSADITLANKECCVGYTPNSGGQCVSVRE